MNSTEWETLLSVRNALAAAPHGGRGPIVKRAAETLGCSVQTLYRKLEEAGLETGRKRRADAGETQMTIEQLRLVSGLLFTSRRDNDKQLLTVEDALDILHHSGQLDTPLSPGRVGQLLREHHLHPDQLAEQKPATELRSLHPNHVWQLDSSTCVLYYMRSGHLAAMDADEFYRNKPENYAKVLHELCTRYAVSDHTSGALKARYFLGGETAQNLVDFFLWAISKQELSPVHGVPLIVMLDPGAANKGHLFQNLCKRLHTRVIINKPKNARAKGQVEKTHDIIERHFEGRFRFFPPEELTLDVINERCEAWAAAFCSNRKHSRHLQPRYSMWMTITQEQLRIPASLEVLRELVTSEPESRRVDNTMRISFVTKGFGKLSYDVSRVPGAVVGGKVMAAVNAYRAPSIDVMHVDPDTGEELWQTVAPVVRDENGFSIDAPVIGESFRTAANTAVDDNRNRLVRDAYGLPSLEEAAKARKQHKQAYAGVVDAMADVKATQVPAYLPRRGTPMDAPQVRDVAPVVLGVAEACKRIKAQLGDAYTPQVYQWVSAKFPDGVPEPQVDAICAQFTQPRAEGQGGEGLRAVGGGQ